MPDKMLSLHDYLGYPAEKQIVEQVTAYAKIRNAEKTYTGPVMLYTRAFLDECFEVKKIFEDDYTEINTQLMEDSFKSQ